MADNDTPPTAVPAPETTPEAAPQPPRGRIATILQKVGDSKWVNETAKGMTGDGRGPCGWC